MVRAPARLTTALALAALLGCAHAQPPALPELRWPLGEARALLRWAGTFPDERALAQRRSALRRFFDALLGVDPLDDARRAAILARPFGVAARGDRLYVADPDGAQVLAVDWREGTFEPVGCEEPWKTPMAVAVAEDGALFVADAGARRVVRVAGGTCTPLGEGLVRPTGVALLGGRVFVVDPPQHAVFAFPVAGGPGTRFGVRGEDEGQLNYPTAVAATPGGDLVVVDALNWRVVTYSADGVVKASFGEPGTEGGGFGRPKAVAVDARGRFFVSDAQYGVILVFDAAGVFQYAFGGSAREPQGLSLPAGLALAGTSLFVADAYHHRIERYELLEDAP